LRVLVVEDDARLRAVLVRSLSRAGLTCDEAGTLGEGDELLDLHAYDLLLLDRRLPDGDGLELCRAARRRGFAASILVLTALDDPHSTVEGLGDGADEYVGKPFDLDVLTARVKALLRRNLLRPTEELVVGDLRVDPWRRAVWCGSAALPLTAREYQLVEALARAAGGIVSREDLLEQAWGERDEPMSNTVDVLISRLRRKLVAAGSRVAIETARGLGYRLQG